MTKLPVLYVSCDAQVLSQPKGQSSLRRLIRNQDVDSLVLISLGAGLSAPEIRHSEGGDGVALQLYGLLKEDACEPVLTVRKSAGLKALAGALFCSASVEAAELRLNLGMTEIDYRRIGQCLETCRELGMLIICFDEIGETDVGKARPSPYDADVRNMIRQWEDEQRWATVLSKSETNVAARVNEASPLSDPTLCILNTAFSLGGMQAPRRVFGSSLNAGRESLAGYVWMH